MVFAALGVFSSGLAEAAVRLYRSDGTYSERHLQEANPKKPIKFAVGSPGQRSGLWRVWSPKDKDDVYVKPISVEGFTKISLHETGDWRHQVLFERTDDPNLHFVKLPDEQSRILEQWQRPEQYAEGWTEALTILVPSEDVVRVPSDPTKPSDVSKWISHPPPGECSEFRVNLVKDGAPVLVLDWSDWLTRPIKIVGAYRTIGGEAVLVTHHRTRLSEGHQAKIERLRIEMGMERPSDFSISARTGPRMIGSAVGNDDRRFLLDLAINPNSSTLLKASETKLRGTKT